MYATSRNIYYRNVLERTHGVYTFNGYIQCLLWVTILLNALRLTVRCRRSFSKTVRPELRQFPAFGIGSL